MGNHMLRTTKLPKLRAPIDFNSELESAPDEHPVNMASIGILVADDHAVVREGLVSVIHRNPNFRLVAEAANGQEAVEAYERERPDIVLLDLRMPRVGGLEAMCQILQRDPSARVVILTTYETEEDIFRALQAGAAGYFLKESPIQEIVRCIQTVAGGRTWIPPEVGAKLAKRVAVPELTTREKEVLRAVARGKSNKEIGVALEIEESTVKVHMTHILEKLKVTGRTEAINIAIRRGLVRIAD